MYNIGKKITRVLEALNKYVPKDVEIIIVDDGSTDTTKSVIEKFLQKIRRKKTVLLSVTHGGPAKARNTGWKKAKGSIIIFLDSDCVVTKDWYKEMMKLFKKDVVAVQGRYVNANPNNIISKYEQMQIDLRQENFDGKIKPIDNFATYSLAIRRWCLEKVGGFDESFSTSSGEDTLLSYKVKELGRIIHNPNAKVKHFHRYSLWSYLKKQYIHGKNRVLLYKKIKFKKIGDKYAGMRILLQPFLAGFSLLSIFHPYFLTSFFLLCLLQLKEISKISLKFETFVLNILRAYAWFFGMTVGIIRFILLPSKN